MSRPGATSPIGQTGRVSSPDEWSEARRIAGTEGPDVRRTWLVLIAGLGAAWSLPLFPEGLRLPLVLLGLAIAASWWWSARARRREAYDALSPDDKVLVDLARHDASPTYVAMLWTVLGVAAFIGVLYGAQLVVPPAEGATASTTTILVIVSTCATIAVACRVRLRQVATGPRL